MTFDSPLSLLNQVFGYNAFKGLQEPVIEHALQGGDAVALMPTGSGKSLCYQIPAMLRPGVGVVVSPLIALMHDQVQALLENGVRAAALHSGLPPGEARRIEESLSAQSLDLIYLAPERLLQARTLEMLDRVPLSLIAIDEAHCVSRWGHDFRPEYARLGFLGQRFPQVPRLALTATADAPTRKDIVELLDLQQAKIFAAGFDRPNILYRVEPKDRGQEQLLRFIEDGRQGLCGIVYRLSRNKTDSTAAWLASHGVPALAYHAGVPAAERQRRQDRFMREDGLVMVATIAFGMGVDKPDVRFVAHLDPPASLEAYHQETGRAGRDGLPAEAFMLYGLADIIARRAMIERDADLAEQTPDPERDRFRRMEHLKLSALLGFCESAACRRQVLLRYFGEDYPEPCGNCDVCLSPPTLFDGTIVAQKALSCVYRTDQRMGPAHLSDVLMGVANKRVQMLGHEHLKTFGCGKELDKRQWQSVFRQLVAAGRLSADPRNFGGLTLNARSWDILKGREQVMLRQDQDVSSRGRGRAGSTAPKDDPIRTEEARLLRDQLFALRRRLAAEHNVPPYVIFHDTTLLDMIRYRPADLAVMSRLSGMGERKRQAFGPLFLDVLREHAKIHGQPEILPAPPPPRPKEAAKGREMGESAWTTLALFRDLHSVEKTAEARGLTPSTIYSHLNAAVARGELGAREVTGLSEEDIRAIKAVITACAAKGSVLLTTVHEALGGRYSYDILRCLRTEIEARQTSGPDASDQP